MIITCPACASKFSVADGALPPEGHDLKCSSCEHVWFYQPEEIPEESGDDLKESPSEEENETAEEQTDSNELEEALEDILADDDAMPDHEEKPERSAQKPLPISRLPGLQAALNRFLQIRNDKAAFMGYAGAGGVFILVFACLLWLSSPIQNVIPGSRNFFTLFGLEKPLPGKGLAFDKVIAKTETIDKDKENIYVEGNIINLSSHDQAVPMMEVRIENAQGIGVGRWLVEPPEKTLEAEKSVSFQAVYENTDKAAAQASVRFVLKPEKYELPEEESKAPVKDSNPVKDEGKSPAHHPH